MGKILECIYAYICKRNYVGEGSGDKIYTVTKDLSESDKSVLSKVSSDYGRTDLAKIDCEIGVSLDSKNVTPDFRLMSYVYVPKVKGDYNAFICASLRESLRDKSIRGSKELTHLIAFDEIKEDFYVVDMVGHHYFDKHKDIKISASQNKKENDGADLVCEVDPGELDPLSWDAFSSTNLLASHVCNGGKRRAIAEFLHGLLVSVRDEKTLYVAYDPKKDYETFLEYLKVVLKMLPASVANKLSFATALGKASEVKFNICGIPTRNKEYIEYLREKGNVIRIVGASHDYLEVDKGPFASFVENASEEVLQEWLESSSRYYDIINTVNDMDTAISLYINSIGKKFDSDNPIQSLRDVSSCIKVVDEKFDLIFDIDGELRSQIEGVGNQLKPIRGFLRAYEVEDIKEYLVEPIISLYKKCLRKAEKEEAESVLSWLKDVLAGETVNLEEKYYEVLSYCGETVKSELGADYVNFVRLIEKNWNKYESFFDRYLDDLRYKEASSRIALSFLDIYLNEFESINTSKRAMREYFAKKYLQNNPEKFEEIVKIVFSRAKLREGLGYIFEILKDNKVKEELLDNRISFICDYIKDNNLLDNALKYVRNKYTQQTEENKILDKVFERLLEYYFAVPESECSLSDIYDLFKKAKMLLGDASISLNGFVFKEYNNLVLVPNYKRALEKARFEAWNDGVAEEYVSFVKQLKAPNIIKSINQDAISAIEEVLKKYDSYKTQVEYEKEILGCRIDFVVREFLLLKNKTIYNMLVNYVGASKLKSDLQAANIQGKVYENPEFLKIAEKEARDFLSNKESKKKKTFCQEVRFERKRIKRNLGVVSRDLLGGLLGSSIFAVIMAIIAGVLGSVIYLNVADSYFKGIYDLFVGITLVVSFALCWTNYKNRRLKNMFLASTWQSLLFILSTMGIFTLVQFILGFLL